MQLNVIHFKQKIDRLEELYAEVTENLFNKKHEAYSKSLFEYTELKKEILLSLFEVPIHKTDTKYFGDLRKSLQRLTLNGDPFLPDKNKIGAEFREIIEALYFDLDIKLTNQEYDKFGHEHFYSWFSGGEYAKALIKSQLLFLKAERVPKELIDFAKEIRSCFAFQRYIASYALCRTLFEIAVRGIFESNKLHRYETEFAKPTIKYFNEKVKSKERSTIDEFDPSLFDRIEILIMLTKFKNLKNDLHEVRTLGNSIIHENRTANKDTATEMIQKTFNLIHNLYEAN